MKERPILFSAPMVRAILAGAKTQTRRALKPQPPAGCSIHYMLGNESWLPERQRTPLRHTWEAWSGPLYDAKPEQAMCGSHDVRCPYGAPGDRLWVRETVQAVERPCGDDGVYYPADGAWRKIENSREAADRWCDLLHYGRREQKRALAGPNVPAIHTPRWASRLLLDIVSIRVERLQDISEADALAEGVWKDRVIVDSHCAGGRHTEVHGDRFFWDGGADEGYESASEAYFALWAAINGRESLDANPWVWVVEFPRVVVDGKAAARAPGAAAGCLLP